MMAEADLKLYDDNQLLTKMTMRQRRILAAAIDVFAADGYANTSTKLIAAKAGVAEGNIFAKFKNKAGLLDAILEPVMTAVIPSVFTTFVEVNFTKAYATLEAFIKPLVQDRIVFVRANPKVLKILVSEVAYSQARRDQLLSHIPNSQRETIHAELKNLQARGLLRHQSDHDSLATIGALLGGAAVEYLFFAREPDCDHLALTIIKALRP